MFSHRQMGQKGRDLSGAHLIGVTFVMKEDEAFDPLHICFFGTDGIVFQADGGAHLVEEFRRMHP